MGSRREIVDALLFLPAMAGLAAAVFAALWLLIRAGNATLRGWYWLAHDLAGVPHSPALAFAVLLTAATVTATVYGLGRIHRI